jgi:hypothetical protein
VGGAMAAHLAGAIRMQAQVGERFAGAEQCVSGGPVFRIVSNRVRLVRLAGPLNLRGTGQAPTLVAKCRKLDAGAEGSVPNVFVAARLNGAFLTVREHQCDREGLGFVAVGWQRVPLSSK